MSIAERLAKYGGGFCSVRCAISGWKAIAHGWALLLLLCFPSDLTFDPLRQLENWMVDSASRCLDLEGIFHLIDPLQAVLIDSRRIKSLDANGLLSTYGLLALIAVVSAIQRWRLLLLTAALAETILFGATLVPLRVVIAAMLSTFGWHQAWLSQPLMLDAIAFAAGLRFTLTATSFAAFIRGPIAPRQSSESLSRLPRLWNQWVNATLGELMTRDESGFPSVSQSKVEGSASVKSFLSNYFISRRWHLLVQAVPVTCDKLQFPIFLQHYIARCSQSQRDGSR